MSSQRLRFYNRMRDLINEKTRKLDHLDLTLPEQDDAVKDICAKLRREFPQAERLMSQLHTSLMAQPVIARIKLFL